MTADRGRPTAVQCAEKRGHPETLTADDGRPTTARSACTAAQSRKKRPSFWAARRLGITRGQCLFMPPLSKDLA
jgi:hypothetical protein